VVCGHDIGENALIGAGAVVTTNVPAHALMLGVPARQRGWVCECGEILPEDLSCKCGRAYEQGENGLVEK
jgi:UDP-2-acetamido-3-amino-2,3-dideoxy-glucuronate N-acetyltransferase